MVLLSTFTKNWENLIDNSTPKKNKNKKSHKEYEVKILNGKKQNSVMYIFIQILKDSFTYRKMFCKMTQTL